jgi:PilZ domain
MKKTLISQPREILEELQTIVDAQLPLSIYLIGGSTHVSGVKEICERPEGHFLVVNKPSAWKSGSEILFMLYKPQGSPFRGFQFVLAVETESLLVAKIPDEIFIIQRRRFPRLPVPETSKATFFLGRNNRVNVSEVGDISMGGARFVSVPVGDLRIGDVIGPITFSLAIKYTSVLTEVTVPEAKVVRIMTNIADATMNDVGISFELAPDEQGQLSSYLKLLLITLQH